MRKLSFTLFVCFAATLAAARPAAAQDDRDVAEEILSQQKNGQCRVIPILLIGTNQLLYPPVATAKVGQCVCWKSNRDSWSVHFPYGSPFSGGKADFNQGNRCGDTARSGYFKYDLTIEDVSEDPWLDVGS